MWKPILLIVGTLSILTICGPDSIELKLATIYNLKLNSTTHPLYQITIPAPLSKDQNLYISGYSPINDPYQQPTLKITSQGISIACQSESNDLNQVCFVPSASLTVGQKFVVQVTCANGCDARLVAYLSETVQLDLNQQVDVYTQDAPVEKMFKIFIPASLDYSQINLLYSFKGQNLKQGVKMYIKVSPTLVYPSKDNQDNFRIVNWGIKSASVLYKNSNIKPGDSIYVLLLVGPHTQATFQSRAVNRGTAFIQVNQEFYDYLAPNTGSRMYTIDLANVDTSSIQIPLVIVIQEYLGSPKIEVSLNNQFKNQQLLTSSVSTSKARFEITPQMMRSAEFKKAVYVRVSSSWAASYEIYPSLQFGGQDNIQDGVTHYLEVKGNNNGILVYTFDWSWENSTLTFPLQIINQGEAQAELRVYACLQQTQNCKANNFSDESLYKKLQIQDGRTTLTVLYVVSTDCYKNYQQKNTGQYTCTFILLINNEDRTKTGKYAVTIPEKNMIHFLQEGRPYSYKVNKQEYIHFVFFLPMQSIDMPLSVTFFVNTLDGNVEILSSLDVITPVHSDLPNKNIKRGINSITYEGAQLKESMYYLSVYGNQYSDFIVTAIVRRIQKKQDSGNQIPQSGTQIFKDKVLTTEIQLIDSIAQTFLMEKGTQRMEYRFTTFANGNVTLVVTDLVGRVKTYYTKDKNRTRLECEQNYCVIPAQSGDSFFIEVEGDASTFRRFTIVYKQVKQCYRFPIGTPIYVSLDPKDTECLQFSVSPRYPLQISTSLTKLQLLNKDTEIVIQFQSEFRLVLPANNYLLQEENLKKYCPSNQQNQCNFKIKFISYNNSVDMEFVIQRIDGVMTIYDGVLQRMDTTISKTKGKLFRSPINLEESIDIFFVADSVFDCVISARLVSPLQSSDKNNYPNGTQAQSRIWRISTSSDSPALTMLPISKYKLKAQSQKLGIKQGWLAISVYGTEDDLQHAIFEIQISQNQRMLRIGQQHLGFLEPNQIISYETYPSPLSLLSVRSLYDRKCYKLLDENRKEIFNNDVYIEQPKSIPLQYFIQAYQTPCLYQISLQDYDGSILQVIEGFPTRVVLEYRETAYLLYYHNANQTFRIYQFIEAGSSSIYATPLEYNNTKTIDEFIDKKRLNDYQHSGDQINNLEIEAGPNSDGYCYDCYYVIAIRGSPSVQEDVVIVKDQTPVTIKEHTIVDSYLDPNENETFIYYQGSSNGFDLSIDVVYGQVTVTVKGYQDDPEGKVILVQSVVNGMRKVSVRDSTAASAMGGQKSVDTFDEDRKYKIEVQGIKKSLYHLQVIKNAESFRISQGVASKITMPASGFISLEFQSLIDQGKIELSIDSRATINPIRPQIFYTPPGVNRNEEKRTQFVSWVSGKVLLISFNALRGHYSIKLRSQERVQFDFTAVIPKAGITQLPQHTSIVAAHETIFEIYIEDDSYAVIQVYSCEGNMKVRGSNEIKRLNRATPSKDQINLQHQNIGGHFVVKTPENVTGQYFIRVQNKQYSAGISEAVSGLTYMIRYRLLKKTEKNPYQFLDVQSQSLMVYTSEHRENVTIKVSKVRSSEEKLKIKQIRYIFAIGTSPQDIKDYMFCATEEDTKHLMYALVKDSDSDTVQLNVSKSEIIKKMKKKDAYIGAIALVNVQQPSGKQYDDFVYVFEPAFLGQLKSEQVITTMGLFQIMVIIAIILGGLVVVYALIVHAIKVYRGYNSTNQLVEQESENKIDHKSQFQISQQKQAPKSHDEESIS